MIYNLMVLAYFLSAAAFTIGMFLVWRKKLKPGKIFHVMGTLLVAIGMLIGAGMMTYSWMMTGEPPFQTLYQSLVFFSVSTAAVYLVSSRKIPIMGWASAGFILLILAYAYLKQDGELTQRIPPASAS